MGFKPKQIIKMLNVPTSTVYSIKDKLVKEGRREFTNWVDNEYLWTYVSTIDNFDKTISSCNEKLEKLPKKFAMLETELRNELNNTPERMAMVRATLLQSIINLSTAELTEARNLMAQRDRTTEAKARTLNDGPYVRAIDTALKTGLKVTPHLKEVNDMFGINTPVAIESEKPQELPMTTPSPTPSPTLTDDDKIIMSQMDDEPPT